MKNILVSLVLLTTCLSSAVAVAATTRSGIVTIEVDLSAHDAGKAARLWLPYPVTDRDQAVSDIRVAGDFTTSGVYTDRIYGTPILYAEWPKDAASRRLSFTFAVERQQVIRRVFPATEPAWNRADHAQYLRPTSLGPIDNEVKRLADSITRDKITVVAKAKAIYDWCCENMYRDPDTKGCGKGDVCALINKPGGKCTDISSVYVALCRAAGVPAREVFGLRLGKKTEDDITTWQHCWAEFFVPGYGWVPADPADVRKAMLVEKLDLKDTKTNEYRDYFWGGIDAYRVVIASGRDILLNPPQAGPPLNTFGYPYAEIGGKVIDWYKPDGFKYKISFREK